MSKIKDLVDGKRDNLICMIIDANKGISNNQTTYMNLVLQDNSGKIDAKKWDASEKDLENLKVGNVVSLSADCVLYRNNLQLKINEYVVLKDYENLDELVMASPVDADVLELELQDFIEQITNNDIKKIVSTILEKYYRRFIIHPAAKSNHHEYTSGLLHHEVSMLRLAKAIVSLYPNINSSLLYGGIILHDLGKLTELSGPIITDYTTEGKLLGHISIIQTEIVETGKKLNVDEEVITLLQHMVLSHHGKLEFGSPVLPLTLEAEIMFLIDNTDARITMINKATNDLAPGTFSNKIMALDGRHFYKPKFDK